VRASKPKRPVYHDRRQRNLTANAAALARSPAETGSNAQEETASILTQGGTIAIGGFARSPPRRRPERGTTGGNATGGMASITANGGSITVSGPLRALVDSSATGGRGGVTSGRRERRDFHHPGSGGGQVTIAGDVDLVSFGSGRRLQLRRLRRLRVSRRHDREWRGAGTGGSASLIANGGTINVGVINLDVNGFGGAGDLTGGAATGGTVTVTASGGGSIEAALLQSVATGTAGSGETGGAGTGGTVTIQAATGSSITTDYISALAYGRGGNGSLGSGGSGTAGALLVDVAGWQHHRGRFRNLPGRARTRGLWDVFRRRRGGRIGKIVGQTGWKHRNNRRGIPVRRGHRGRCRSRRNRRERHRWRCAVGRPGRRVHHPRRRPS
jgi:hypothetical protein